MAFLFVDRILELEPGKRALGVKHVTPADLFLEKRDDGPPVLLSGIVGETLGQLAAWSILKNNDFTMRPVAGVVGEIGMFDDARVGDTILLDSQIDSIEDDAVRYHSVATVNGKKILTLTDSFGPFLPMEEFNDPAQVRKQFEGIHKPGKLEDVPASDPWDSSLPVSESLIAFDRITSRDEKTLVAERVIKDEFPWFVDHFPRKHVYPLSILLEGLLHLARGFLHDLGRGAYRPHCLRNVKMNDFVRPGSTLVAKLMLKSNTEEEVVFRARCEVEGKRVCIGEAVFRR